MDVYLPYSSVRDRKTWTTSSPLCKSSPDYVASAWISLLYGKIQCMWHHRKNIILASSASEMPGEREGERERKKERVCVRERDEKNVSLKNNNVSVVTENAVIGLSLRTHCIWCLHYIRRKKIRTKSTGIQRNSLFARSWWMCTEDFLPSRPISWSIEERAWCKMLKTAKEIIYTSG